MGRIDARANFTFEQWLNDRYAHCGGYAKWQETRQERPEVQAVAFGVSHATIHQWRKWESGKRP